MSLVGGSIDNLFGGVSQQTPALRLPSQAEVCDNFFPSLVDGLVKYPPTKTVKKLSSDRKNARIHVIDRDKANRYIAVLEPGTVSVYDTTGTPKTVTVSASGAAYLAGAQPRNVGALSVADYTFLYNKTKAVTASNNTTGHRRNAHLVYMKAVSYDTTYTVTVTVGSTTKTATYTTPKNIGTVEEPPAQINSNEVMTALRSGLVGNATISANCELLLYENVLYIGPKSGAPKITVSVTDSRSNTELKHTAEKTQRFSDLPANGVNNYYVEVTGDDSSAFDNYYVVFKTQDGGTIGPGTWEETVRRDSEAVLTPGTMPHALIRNANGTFRFDPITWGRRTAGDDDSAPLPMFVNRPVSEMFLYRNRLGIVSDDNLTTTRAGDLFSFFPETVMTNTDADPISISAGHETVANLKYAVPFQDSLVFFADGVMFQITAPDIFSPETAALKVVTTMDIDTGIRPVNTGNALLFCTANGNYTGVREFYIEADTGGQTENVTAHVPNYITANPRVMTCSTTSEVLAVVTDAEPGTIYTYKYYWSGGRKLQAAWHRRTLQQGDEILDAAFLETTLYLLVYRAGDGTYLEKIDFSEAEISPLINAGNLPLPYIDRLATLTAASEGTENHTAVTLPYALRPTDRAIIVHKGTMKSYAIEQTGSNTGVVPCRFDRFGSASHYHVGLLYDARYEFSTQYLRDTTNGGNTAIQSGRLQFRSWFLTYSHSSFFDVLVRLKQGSDYRYRYAAKPLGNHMLKLGGIHIDKGVFHIPIRSSNDRVTVALTNDTHFPSTFLSVEWEADYTRRSRRI